MVTSRTERLLGTFVLVGAIAIVWWIVEGVRERYWPKMYRVMAYFEDARGIAEGTPVRIAGVRAGWVVGIIPPGFEAPEPLHDLSGLSDDQKRERVKIVFGIFDHVNIRTHKVRVAAMGLMQERYLAIDVGDAHPVPHEGAALLGEIDVSLDGVSEAAKRVQAVFSDPDLLQRIGRFADEMKGLIRGFERVVERGPDVLRRTQRIVRTLGDDATSMIEASSDAIARTEATAEGLPDSFDVYRERIDRIRAEFNAISEAAREMREHMSAGRGNLARFSSDPALSDSLEGVAGAQRMLAYDRSRSKPMSKGTRTLLKVAKAFFFFLEPSDK